MILSRSKPCASFSLLKYAFLSDSALWACQLTPAPKEVGLYIEWEDGCVIKALGVTQELSSFNGSRTQGSAEGYSMTSAKSLHPL